MAMLAGRRQSFGPSGGSQSSPIADNVSRAVLSGFNNQMDASQRQAQQQRGFEYDRQLLQMRLGADEQNAQARIAQKAIDEATTWEIPPNARDAYNKAAEDIADAQMKAASGSWTQEQASQVISNASRVRKTIEDNPVRVARATSGSKQEFSNNDFNQMMESAYGDVMLSRGEGDERPPTDDELMAVVRRKMDMVRSLRGDKPAPAPSPADVIAPTTQPAAQGVAASQPSAGLDLGGVQGPPETSMVAARVQDIERALHAKAAQLANEGRRPTPEELEIKDRLLKERRDLLVRLNASR